MAASSKFWKPGDPSPPAPSAAAPTTTQDAKGSNLSGRTMTMRFMVRGQEAESNKKAEQERMQKEAAARWVAKHGLTSNASSAAATASGPLASSGAPSHVHASVAAPAGLARRVVRDTSTTCPFASESFLALTGQGAAWSGRASFQAFNKGLEAVVSEHRKEKAAAPDADETAMANFAARVQGRGAAAGGAGGKRGREGPEGEGEGAGQDAGADHQAGHNRKQHKGAGAHGKGKKGGQGLNMVVARKGGIGKRR